MRSDVCNVQFAVLVALAAILPAAIAERCWADPAPLPAALVEHHCNACHAAHDPLIGPPLLAVAARYAAATNRRQTIEVLATKIRLGGGGNWGIVPMVPNADLSTEEARSLVQQILSLKPPAG